MNTCRSVGQLRKARLAIPWFFGAWDSPCFLHCQAVSWILQGFLSHLRLGLTQ